MRTCLTTWTPSLRWRAARWITSTRDRPSSSSTPSIKYVPRSTTALFARTVYNLRIYFNLSLRTNNRKINLPRLFFPQIIIIINIEYQYLIIISEMFDQDPDARVKRAVCSLNQQFFFYNFNLSIWASKPKINLSGSKIYWSWTTGRVLTYRLHVTSAFASNFKNKFRGNKWWCLHIT